jgi:putative transposase
MVTPDAKRKAVCQALRVDRSTVRYTSTRPDEAPLREAMKAVATERRRFGYRRIHIMLERDAIVMNQKKLRRLYREEKLEVLQRFENRLVLSESLPGQFQTVAVVHKLFRIAISHIIQFYQRTWNQVRSGKP